MKKKEERNSEGVASVVVVMIAGIVLFCGEMEPKEVIYVTAGLSAIYNLGRAYIKASPSKNDDEALAKVNSIAEEIKEFLAVKK